MILTFSQGIVAHEQTIGGLQNFLQQSGTTVNLNTSNTPTIIAFAHRDTNYLFSETTSVIGAWSGPFNAGTDYYLYWDINLSTGIRTFGHTLLNPIASASAPIAPQIDQHWFNTSTRIMQYWNGSVWIEVIRVFSAKLNQGVTLISVSDNAPSFLGTQVGSLGSFNVGSFIFDPDGNPLKRNNRRFFTTEDLFTTGLPTSSRTRIESFVLDALATTSIPDYSMVAFTDFNKIGLLNPVIQPNVVFGMVESGVTVNELTKITVDGVVNNSQWNWDFVNQQIFTDNTGQLVTTAGGYFPIVGQTPVAVAIDKTTILLRPSKLVLDGGGSAGLPATTTTLGVVKISVPPSVSASPIAVETNDPRLLQTFQHDPTPHTHVKADITDFPHNHDTLYYTQTLLNAGQLDTRYYTKLELDANSGNIGAKVDKVVGTVGDLVSIDAIGNLISTGASTSAFVQKSGDTMISGANLSFVGGEVLGLPTIPSVDSSAASKFYVDQIAAGIHVRESVKASTTAALPASTYTGTEPGAFLTATVNGVFPPQDGFTFTAVGQRVLVKDQVNLIENGVYIITQLGDGTSPWIITRCPTCDQSTEVPGSFVFVEQGSTLQGQGFFPITPDPFVLNNAISGTIQWTPISSGVVFSSDGVTILNTANVFSVIQAGIDHALITNGGGTNSHTQIDTHIANTGIHTDAQVKVSVGDTTPNYLLSKLVAGSNVTLTQNNIGANETITIASTGGGGGTTITALTDTTITTPACGDDFMFVNNGIVQEWRNVSPSIARPYDFAVFSPGLPVVGTDIFRFTAARGFKVFGTLGFGLGLGAVPTAKAQIAGTGSVATFTVKKNATAIGTFVFNPGVPSGIASGFVDTSFVATDDLVIEYTTADSGGTLADVNFTILAGLEMDCTSA